jgi:hypothetical protein
MALINRAKSTYTKDMPRDAGSYSYETEGIWKALLLRVG